MRPERMQLFGRETVVGRDLSANSNAALPARAGISGRVNGVCLRRNSLLSCGSAKIIVFDRAHSTFFARFAPTAACPSHLLRSRSIGAVIYR